MQTYAPRLRELTLTYRVRRTIAGDEIRFGGCASNADATAKILVAILADEPREVFGLLCVTPQQRVIGYHEVSRGPLCAASLHPGEVFRAAILANAAGVILAHSHPRGDGRPTEDDTAIARQLTSAGEIVGIPVLDYIVIGAGRHVSLRETGQM